MDQRFVSQRFPRSSRYHPEWVIASVSGGANSLWLAEWLAGALDLRPGMRVLDLGCGRGRRRSSSGASSACRCGPLTCGSALRTMQRIRDAGVEDGVFPIHADARSLPFAADSSTPSSASIRSPTSADGRSVPELPRAVREAGRPGGHCGGGTGAGDRGPVPEHLRAWWTQDLGGASIRRRGGGGTGSRAASWISKWPTRCRTAGSGGWTGTGPSPRTTGGNPGAGGGPRRYLGYVRVVGRRRPDVRLSDPVVSVPVKYTKAPLLRSPT